MFSDVALTGSQILGVPSFICYWKRKCGWKLLLNIPGFALSTFLGFQFTEAHTPFSCESWSQKLVTNQNPKQSPTTSIQKTSLVKQQQDEKMKAKEETITIPIENCICI